MPKRRRKQVVTHTTPELPFPKVRVEWIDILSDSGWATDKEFDKMNLSYPVNEGWLYSKDNKAIKLFASFDKDDDGTITFGDRTMIPTSCVKKILKI
jgi:Ca2+-binding EF-hand superfamily protein|tara:strand:- start:13 stop:303 length:291 start_codon:yes stop_codon:yes gene_type:complete